MPASIITLTTDFGLADSYVAQMKGAILSKNPNVTIVDVTHEISPQDVVRGSMVLGEIWRSFPAGTIHVAVVDPGVGTSRRILGAKCAGRFFVLPDNGLLSFVLRSSPADEIVELQNANFWHAHVSRTFHGRDIMAPVAAHLSRGVQLRELGTPATDVCLLEFPSPRFDQRRLVGQIISIDGFGNLMTNIESTHLQQIPVSDAVVCCNEQQIRGISQTYAERSPGEVIALLGSQGYLELAIVNGNAARTLDAQISDTVSLTW